MPVYVSDMMGSGWRHGDACGMYADTLEELHKMAFFLKLKRKWFKKHKLLPHYSLNLRLRKIAIEAGAIPQTVDEMLEFARKNKK